MLNREELTFAGYIFANGEDLELAKNEEKKIAYIESHTDMTNISIVMSVYEKALENRTFQTPLGLDYMHSLQDIMHAAGIPDSSIKPIPLYTTFRRISLNKDDEKPVKSRMTKKQREELTLKMKYRNACLVAAIFAFLAFAMLIITLNGSTPNAINYKNAITNEYAAWEQDLSARESVIREKERELNISR